MKATQCSTFRSYTQIRISGRTVTYWSVYMQTWTTCDIAIVPDRELAAMSARNRARVERAIVRNPLSWTEDNRVAE